MFKKTWNSPHFLSRTASHSTKGLRNGRVDVMPRDAEDPLYLIADQIADGQTRLEELKTQKDELAHRIFENQRLNALKARLETKNAAIDSRQLTAQAKAVDTEIERHRRHLCHLRRLLSGAGNVTLEGVFLNVARAQLSPAVFAAILQKAETIIQRGGGRK